MPGQRWWKNYLILPSKLGLITHSLNVLHLDDRMHYVWSKHFRCLQALGKLCMLLVGNMTKKHHTSLFTPTWPQIHGILVFVWGKCTWWLGQFLPGKVPLRTLERPFCQGKVSGQGQMLPCATFIYVSLEYYGLLRWRQHTVNMAEAHIVKK